MNAGSILGRLLSKGADDAAAGSVLKNIVPDSNIGRATALADDLPIYHGASEEPLTVYRGGKPFNRDLVRFDGASFSTDKSIADRWRGSYRDGVLEEYHLSPDTKILVAPKPDVPLGQITDSDKFSLVAKAQLEGYDAVDMAALGESEMRVINPERLEKKVDGIRGRMGM